MTKLTGTAIEVARNKGSIIIDPWDPTCLGPNSYDLHLSPHLFEYYGTGYADTYWSDTAFDMKQEAEGRHFNIGSDGYVLRPRHLYLGSTMERAGSTRYVPCIEGRSSVARLGLFIHITAGFGDIGWTGHWTLELVATHPIRIYPGVRICQIYFDTTKRARTSRRTQYTGKYALDDTHPVPSRLWQDFLPIPSPDAPPASTSTTATTLPTPPTPSTSPTALTSDADILVVPTCMLL